MAILVENLRLIYIQVPGNGCSVAGKFLRNEANGIDIGNKHDSLTELSCTEHSFT